MIRDLFSKIFPTPDFLKMPAIGFDMSDQSIRFVELKNGQDGLVLGRWGKKEFNKGIIELGRIVNKAEIKKILSNISKQYKLNYINASLSEEQGYLFRMSLPALKKSELRDAIELQAEEHIPIKVTEAYFDYKITNKNNDGYSVSVVAIPRIVSDSYLELFDGTGLSPTSFEIEANAIARAVVKNGDTDTYMVVDFGRERTGIFVVSAGEPVFTSTLEIGGDFITDNIATKFDISYDEAEKIKREKGMNGLPENKALYSVLLESVAILRDEINRHYIYWHSHKEFGEVGKKKIEKVILCGGDSNLPGLSEYLGSSLKLKVELANVWINVNPLTNYVPEIDKQESLSYATAIGLALGGMQKND